MMLNNINQCHETVWMQTTIGFVSFRTQQASINLTNLTDFIKQLLSVV